MNAMILAAGRGERMRPLTDTCPKPLLEINGKRLIEYHLEALRLAGIDRVVINTSWLAEQLEQALGNGDRYGLKIDYSFEAEPLETAGGIVQALPKLDETFIVVNGDVFTDYEFMNPSALSLDAHLVLVNNPEHNPHGDFAINSGYLSNDTESRYTFSGIGYYRKSFFADLEPGRCALAPLLREAASQHLISAELFTGSWSDVGTVERLTQLQSKNP